MLKIRNSKEIFQLLLSILLILYIYMGGGKRMKQEFQYLRQKCKTSTQWNMIYSEKTYTKTSINTKTEEN